MSWDRGRRFMKPASYQWVVLLAAVVAVPWLALAQLDAPHWSSASITIDCTSQCHTLHNAVGVGLTPEAENAALCQSCHSVGNLAEDLAVSNTDMAVPGVTGTFHAFGVSTTSTAAGAKAPQTQEMLLRIMDGAVTCSTCHNQHDATATDGGTPRISATTKVNSGGGTGGMTAGGTYTGPGGIWYLIDIATDGEVGAARFRYSKDNGLSWIPNAAANCDPPGTTTGCTLTGASVGLDNGISVSFTAAGGTDFRTGVPGDQWEFNGSYPFMRITIDDVASQMCGDCHRDWVMNAAQTNTYTGNAHSHPVGVAIPATAEYHNPPLDGTGIDQATGDGISSNDLRTAAGTGEIHCLTCHGVHWADGNTATEDVP